MVLVAFARKKILKWKLKIGSLLGSDLGGNIYAWGGKETGLRRWRIPIKSSADLTGRLRARKSFIFVQNWMEGAGPLYT